MFCGMASLDSARYLLLLAELCIVAHSTPNDIILIQQVALFLINLHSWASLPPSGLLPKLTREWTVGVLWLHLWQTFGYCRQSRLVPSLVLLAFQVVYKCNIYREMQMYVFFVYQNGIKRSRNLCPCRAALAILILLLEINLTDSQNSLVPKVPSYSSTTHELKQLAYLQLAYLHICNVAKWANFKNVRFRRRWVNRVGLAVLEDNGEQRQDHVKAIHNATNAWNMIAFQLKPLSHCAHTQQSIYRNES